MITEIISILYLLMPAYFANMTPVFLKKINLINYPLDFKTKFRGKRIFGTNKTFRGLIGGIIVGTIIYYIQQILHTQGFTKFSYIDYTNYSIWLGALIGLVTIIGDAIESFVKRQLDKRPGKPWVPFDQLDFVIANFIVLSFFIQFSWINMIIASILIVMGDIVIQFLGYKIGMKKDIL